MKEPEPEARHDTGRVLIRDFRRTFDRAGQGGAGCATLSLGPTW